MTPIVFLRHGQSVWNHERRFTGWADVELSSQGRQEAETAGRLIKEAGYSFDVCFTSVLQRAQRTLEIVLQILEHDKLPIHTSWRLNERHYGALQGWSRQEMAAHYSPEQVTIWQQHFDVPPPLLEPSDARFPGHDPRYADLPPSALPRGESLKDVRSRVLPYWRETILPQIQTGKKILIVAHGNSLRALATYLDDVPEADIAQIKRPLTGEPLVYELDHSGRPLQHFYLRRTPKLQRWATSKFRSLGSIASLLPRGSE